MRRVSVERLNEGDILGRTIYTAQGRVLLGSGVPLTISLISRLKQMGITIVYQNDEQTRDIIIEDVISEENRRNATTLIELASDAINLKKNFDEFGIKKAVNNIVEDILSQKKIVLNLMDMRSFDNQMYAHAVNVCVLSTVLAKTQGLDRDKIDAMAQGALLHDIGTTKLPKSLINKRTPFTEKEFELYRTHTQIGFDILREKKDLSILSAHVAFQHHEWLNATGYPRQLVGDQIHLIAQIVGIADFYDNLVNDGPGHQRIAPNEACEYLMGSSGRIFNQDLVVAFLKHVAIFPTGSQVKLSNGEVGVVVKQHDGLPLRPFVRVFREGSNHLNFQIKEYNLVEEQTLLISGILE